MKTYDLLKWIFTSVIVVALVGCGGSGTKNSGGGGARSSTLTGRIQSSTGSTSDFKGWMMALVGQSTGESRVAEIDAQGSYEFKHVDQQNGYTMVLLNPDYRLSSVLAMVASDAPGKVYQWFDIAGSILPTVVHKGPSMSFSDVDSISLLPHVSNDENGDGIPDGMKGASSSLAPDHFKPLVSEAFALADADEDGIENENDADVDGDGLPNWFDSDDNNNGTLDIFDLDANGDLVLDSNQKVGDHYFGKDVEYIAVQIFSEPNSILNAKFTVKIGSAAVKPESIAVMGASKLFDESRILVRRETGKEDPDEIWDRSLKDDGDSFDSGVNDRIYSQKIRFKTGRAPSANQVVFLSVNYGSYTREFPFTFSKVTLGEVTFSYSASNRRITKLGNPFGEKERSYLWTVAVFDDDGGLVHLSAPQEATITRYTIPAEDIDDSAIVYKAKVFAQSLEKVPGYPVYVNESEEANLE